MLKNHPKGLLVAFFANMGERFGFYTMMAILVLFLQAKYGLSAEKAGGIYSWFYFSIYALALVGGILADSTRKYKTVILFGIIIMFGGYLLMAIPGMTLTFTIIGLFTIAFGNGLFKGNLQAVVGQMYDNPQYSKLRDTAFMIFYMGINVGAFFAPFAATAMRNWWLKTNGFAHDGSLPALCHRYLEGNLTDTETFSQLAANVSLNGQAADLTNFANTYLEVFSKGYNYAFGIAAGAMVISMLVYIFFGKLLPNKEKKVTEVAEKVDFQPAPARFCNHCNGCCGIRTSFYQAGWLGRRFCIRPLRCLRYLDHAQFNKGGEGKSGITDTCVCGCGLLLDVFPPERINPDSLCT